MFAEVQSDPRLRFDIVRLEKMPERVGAQPNPFVSLPVTLHPSAAYMMALGSDWETFYRTKRSSSTRQRDRSKRQKLGRYGEVRFTTPDDDGDIVHTLDTLMAQKGRWFAAMGVGDLFAQPGHREFYRAVATDPCSRNLVHVSRLDVGSEIGAANVGLVFRGRYYHLLASYSDAEMSRFAPGVAHLHELMQWATQHGCALFDFTIGDERYKRDWCEIELKLYDHVSGATPMGAVLAPVMRAATKTKRWIKQNPKAWAAASWLRRTVGALRHRRPGD